MEHELAMLRRQLQEGASNLANLQLTSASNLANMQLTSTHIAPEQQSSWSGAWSSSPNSRI